MNFLSWQCFLVYAVVLGLILHFVLKLNVIWSIVIPVVLLLVGATAFGYILAQAFKNG